MLDLARTWFWLVGRAGETDRDRAGVTARGGTSSPEAVRAMGVPKDARLCCIDSGGGPPSKLNLLTIGRLAPSGGVTPSPLDGLDGSRDSELTELPSTTSSSTWAVDLRVSTSTPIMTSETPLPKKAQATVASFRIVSSLYSS